MSDQANDRSICVDDDCPFSEHDGECAAPTLEAWRDCAKKMRYQRRSLVNRFRREVEQRKELANIIAVLRPIASDHDELMARLRDVIPEDEHPKEETVGNWSWQLKELASDRKAAYDQRDRARSAFEVVCKERDTYRNKLAEEHDLSEQRRKERDNLKSQVEELKGRLDAARLQRDAYDRKLVEEHHLSEQRLKQRDAFADELKALKAKEASDPVVLLLRTALRDLEVLKLETLQHAKDDAVLEALQQHEKDDAVLEGWKERTREGHRERDEYKAMWERQVNEQKESDNRHVADLLKSEDDWKERVREAWQKHDAMEAELHRRTETLRVERLANNRLANQVDEVRAKHAAYVRAVTHVDAFKEHVEPLKDLARVHDAHLAADYREKIEHGIMVAEKAKRLECRVEDLERTLKNIEKERDTYRDQLAEQKKLCRHKHQFYEE